MIESIFIANTVRSLSANSFTLQFDNTSPTTLANRPGVYYPARILLPTSKEILGGLNRWVVVTDASYLSGISSKNEGFTEVATITVDETRPPTALTFSLPEALRNGNVPLRLIGCNEYTVGVTFPGRIDPETSAIVNADVETTNGIRVCVLLVASSAFVFGSQQQPYDYSLTSTIAPLYKLVAGHVVSNIPARNPWLIGRVFVLVFRSSVRHECRMMAMYTFYGNEKTINVQPSGSDIVQEWIRRSTMDSTVHPDSLSSIINNPLAIDQVMPTFSKEPMYPESRISTIINFPETDFASEYGNQATKKGVVLLRNTYNEPDAFDTFGHVERILPKISPAPDAKVSYSSPLYFSAALREVLDSIRC
jgi:hypothetical protein